MDCGGVLLAGPRLTNGDKVPERLGHLPSLNVEMTRVPKVIHPLQQWGWGGVAEGGNDDGCGGGRSHRSPLTCCRPK